MRLHIVDFVCLGLVLAALPGCVAYSTLQTAKTLSPGQVLIGGGGAVPVAKDDVTFFAEVHARVGIVRGFDLGAKYIAPSLIFVDGKYQIMDVPFALSADLGWSYFSYDDVSSNRSRGTTTAWYPMIMIGQDTWYVAVKGVYLSTEGGVEFFGMVPFRGSGWSSTNLVVGGVVGDKVRLLPEVNIIVPRTGTVLFVPAVALQFVF